MFRALDETDSGYVSVILMLQCLGEENTEIVSTKNVNMRIQSTAVRDTDIADRRRESKKRENRDEEEEGEEEEEEEEEEEKEEEDEKEEEKEEYDNDDFNNNRSELGFLVLQAIGRFMFSLLVNGLHKSMKLTQKTGGAEEISLTWGEVRPFAVRLLSHLPKIIKFSTKVNFIISIPIFFLIHSFFYFITFRFILFYFILFILVSAAIGTRGFGSGI